MKTRYNVFRAAAIAAILFSASVSYSLWDDNQVSDCASVTPKGGIKLPSTKVGTSSKGELVVKNTSATKVVISDVDQDGGGSYKDFSVDKTALPVTLMPGESHSFICTYSPTAPVPWTSGTFAIYVFRFEGSDLDTSICHYINFVLSGDTLGTQSGVATSDDASTFNVYPNPATEKVDVSVTKGFMQKAEVFNALGTVVAEAKNVQGWTWDLRTTSGAKATSGIYFVRAVVIGSNGEYVTTKKVVVK
jgi:hypothetical protein